MRNKSHSYALPLFINFFKLGGFTVSVAMSVMFLAIFIGFDSWIDRLICIVFGLAFNVGEVYFGRKFYREKRFVPLMITLIFAATSVCGGLAKYLAESAEATVNSVEFKTNAETIASYNSIIKELTSSNTNDRVGDLQKSANLKRAAKLAEKLETAEGKQNQIIESGAGSANAIFNDFARAFDITDIPKIRFFSLALILTIFELFILYWNVIPTAQILGMFTDDDDALSPTLQIVTTNKPDIERANRARKEQLADRLQQLKDYLASKPNATYADIKAHMEVKSNETVRKWLKAIGRNKTTPSENV